MAAAEAPPDPPEQPGAVSQALIGGQGTGARLRGTRGLSARPWPLPHPARGRASPERDAAAWVEPAGPGAHLLPGLPRPQRPDRPPAGQGRAESVKRLAGAREPAKPGWVGASGYRRDRRRPLTAPCLPPYRPPAPAGSAFFGPNRQYVRWDTGLHEVFVQAVDELGGAHAGTRVRRRQPGGPLGHIPV